MKRYIIVLPDGREMAFFGDERAALVFAQGYRGTLKEAEGASAPSAPQAGDAQSDEEEGSKSRRKR